MARCATQRSSRVGADETAPCSRSANARPSKTTTHAAVAAAAYCATSRLATPALRRYVAFVRHEVARKYSGVGYRFRFYAHADLASDHEAVSLYHAFLAQWQTK